jgi:prepilin-type N-terminal cleavage/methylation domain-containing protein
MTSSQKHAAFTLIEISIVLVIIGLIVGGVLVGRELIKAAEIRASISQIDKYNQATLAFQLKYNGLPGDLQNATSFGMTNAQGSGLTIYSPRNNALGDGLIMSCQDDSLTTTTYAPYGYLAFGCENAIFWVHLSAAGLIEGGFTQTLLANGFASVSGSQADLYLPRSKLARNHVRVYAWNGLNYFHLQGINSGLLLSDPNGSTTASNKLSPQEAFQIDSKLDDGSPISGSVRAFDEIDGMNTRLGLTAGSPTTCRNASNQYGTGGAVANNELCQIQIKAAF